MKLTSDQEKAKSDFVSFLLSEDEPYMVIKGHSGTGKSELVKQLIEELPSVNETIKLLTGDDKVYEPVLSATTNKAADVLRVKTGKPVTTVHSLLGIKVDRNSHTGFSLTKENKTLYDAVLFIDEASFIDENLFNAINKRVNRRTTKIVFIGDPYQLAPVGNTVPYVFSGGLKTPFIASLEEVVRQSQGSALHRLGEALRLNVKNREFPKLFVSAPEIIYHQDKAHFMAEIDAEFLRPDWENNDSKILSWTNKTATHYNDYVKAKVTGSKHILPGDVMVVNSYINYNDAHIKADTEVMVTSCTPAKISIDIGTLHDVPGYYIELSRYKDMFFMPESLEVRAKILALLKKKKMFNEYYRVEDTWLDLRSVYASTINKAQGSTYKKVFIDLDDFKRCKYNREALARLLYVACTRPTDQLILTGDI